MLFIIPKTFNSSRRFGRRLTPPPARPEAGFTLVELIVAIGLFALVSLIAIGALTSMLGAGQKSRELASVLNDLNFTLESMTREIRFGYDYRCGVQDSNSDYPNCPEGEDKMTVTFRNQGDVTYELYSDKIVRIDEDGNSDDVTSDQVTITDLTFFVTGVDEDDDSDQSPSAVISVSGYAGSETEGSRFTLQTSMSRRGTESAWKQYGEGTVSLSTEEVKDGTYSMKKDDYDDPNGGWKLLEDEDLGRDFEMTGWIYWDDDSDKGQAQLAVLNEDFGGYGFSLDYAQDQIYIEYRQNGSQPEDINNENADNDLALEEGEWYEFEFSANADNTFTLEVQDDSGNNSATVTSASDDRVDSFDRVGVHGGSAYYIDQLQVMDSDDQSVFQAGF